VEFEPRIAFGEVRTHWPRWRSSSRISTPRWSADGARLGYIALGAADQGGIFTPQFAWTPDGRRLLYTRVASTVPGDDDASALYALDVASGRNVKLTAHTKLDLTP